MIRTGTEISDLKRKLISLQAESGAFESLVHQGRTASLDWNGVTTALVLREMQSFVDEAWIEPLNRSLDFLEQCESVSGSGMFSFWPSAGVPSWAPYNPDDCDSTAIIASQLLHFGRMTPERARFIALSLMPEFQMNTGGLRAWRSNGIVPNPFDVVLNINAVAFLAQTGSHRSAVYRDACRAIGEAVTACGRSLEQLDRIMPYYPESGELFVALAYARKCGVRELLPAESLLGLFATITAPENVRILFANEGRRTVWSSEAVRIARRICSTL